MHIAPFEYFTIVRQIEDPLDISTAYYPQSEIRNAETDELITTLDLASKGDGRYSKRWQVPADVSGLGFYVTIITKVYTDSGHTTESPNYGRKEQTLFVKERRENVGGGSGLTGRDVEAILIKVLTDFDFPTNETDLKPLVKAIGKIPGLTADRIDIPEVKIPKQKQTDLTPVLNAIQESHKATLEAIKGLDIPDYQNTLRTIQELVRGLDARLDKADIEGAIKLLPELNTELSKIPEYMNKVGEAEKALQQQVLTSQAVLNNGGGGERKGPAGPKMPSRLRAVMRKTP